ncbi:MAG: HD-GYP domain-containing protein [Gemmatimonadota bacterium]|nr:HD-GYP domain-containing protein [Gemmatimonadota bacterium]
MTGNKRAKEITGVTTVLAILLLATVFLRYPPSFSSDFLIAYLTLMGLGIIATLLHLRFSSAGYTSSMDFVPELGAILLLGPSGALLVTVGSELVSGFFLERQKPVYKKLFNTSQLVLAVGLASIAYVQLGGVSSLTSLSFQAVLAPFVVSVLVYFAVNTGTVSYIVSAYESAPFLATWRQLTGGLIVFDLTMSSLAFALAWFYVQVDNPVFVFAAIIPLIGLRYSYGTNFELQRLNQDLLRLMVKTIEAQDPYTSGHSLRVAAMARVIGESLGLRGKQLRNLENAALLHDLGKIDVAYSEILRQKGPLTPEQRQLIREHPQRGVDIVRSVRSIPEEVLAFIRHHHERWDGEGYPDGLAGKSIPLGARIIMVCDTIDAMATARPYREPLPVTVVRDELIKNAGTQFDERVVRQVLALNIVDELETRPVSYNHGA